MIGELFFSQILTHVDIAKTVAEVSSDGKKRRLSLIPPEHVSVETLRRKGLDYLLVEDVYAVRKLLGENVRTKPLRRSFF